MKNLKSRIPWLGRKLLQILVPDHQVELIIGDFEEYLAAKMDERGRSIARLLFWYQLFISTPAFVTQSIRFRVLIFRHSIQMAVRNLRRHFVHSLLNLVGLSIGIASFLIIMLYVQDERSFDTFHEKSDRIYRVLDFRKVNNMGEESASAPIPLAERMLIDYPEEVQAAVRFFNFQAPTLALAYQEPSGELRQFNEPKLFFVDKEFFEVFDFGLKEGDTGSALIGPNKIVLNAEMAAKYFDSEDPIGRIIRFEDKHDFVVSGVLDELPSNTHLKFDFLVSFETLDNPEVLREGLRTRWIWNPCWTYLLLKPGVSAESLENQFPSFVKRHFPESRHDRVKLYLQPLEDIHLYSDLDYEMGPNSNVIYIRIFTTIAIFIILISCINFINLVTARASKRYIEIGIRKVLGSNRAQLIWQLLHESFFLSFIALLLALLIIWVALPFVNELTSKHLVLDPIQYPWMLKWLVITYLSVSTLSGVYPALTISRHQPSQVIKGYLASVGKAGSTFRKFLVVGQFGLSIVLIIGTIVALRQFNYLQKQQLGFQPEQVVLLPTLRSLLMERYDAFKGALLQNPDILSLTTVEDVPGMRHQTGGYEAIEGMEQQFPRLIVHDDFAQTLGIEMAAGRDFLSEFSTDADDAVIINEAMVRLVGWESAEAALDKLFDDEKVVGVVKDFHFSSLHNPIGPFVLERVSDDARSLSFSARYIAIRVQTDRIQETLEFIENKWLSFVPNAPFEYSFLNNMLATQYKGESTLGKLVAIFCSLSILIACMGLYGLASFTARQRLKEIGIRKVMGASVSGLVLMLSSSFLKLVGFSILLAWPVAYLVLDEWLQEFAYRIDMNIWSFLISGLLGLLVVFLTVSFQALKVCLTNPVNTLRNE
ncbi:ABC transporter permease [Fulvivirgaceae bacterium BMA10]|uniref:ABC transporter permease n=1 Tax=Splendidivirga corallicola TaxID=3051826 RepID=A0ABT8KXG6_9BACT|nr:ABC transporter permease [Fulvivirgaceae bacterium BMA10]